MEVLSLMAIYTDSAPAPRGFYSQAVRAGSFLFIAGQLPLDSEGHLVSDSISDQTRQALSNVNAILQAAGGSLADLAQCTLYISDIAHWPEVDKVYEAFLSGKVGVAPARAVIPVKEMHCRALIVIQAIAVFPRS
jgi:2-iminobutanoate/2-iminopropanoate deaminase